MSAFGDTLCGDGWILIWIVFMATGLYALYDTVELAKKLKKSKEERLWIVARLILLWIIPLFALLGAIGAQWSADRLEEVVNEIKPKPFKERLIDVLNGIDVKILAALPSENDPVEITSSIVPISKYEELEKLSKEPDSEKYFTILGHENLGMIFGPGDAYTGVAVRLNLRLTHEVLK